MATNGKADMDCIEEKSAHYILEWQRLRALRESKLTYFWLIPFGSQFTLPGGTTKQTKLNPRQAEAEGGAKVGYQPWEWVAPV